MRKTIKTQLDLFYQWPKHKLGNELKKISEILDRHPRFSELVHTDLTSDQIKTGTFGMCADQVLRAGILKNILKLSYDRLSFNTCDSKATRAFMLMDFDENYSASCLQDNVSKISEATWETISKTLVLDARSQGIENCTKARVDSTVTDSNIQHPTDSKLLYDCLRVLNREFKRLRLIADKKSWRLISDTQVKTVKKLRYQINNAKNAATRLPYYKELLKTSEYIKKELPVFIVKAEKVFNKKGTLNKHLEIIKDIDSYLEKVIYQTNKRVIKGQTVPVDKKIVSIFEPHTDIIVKDRRETQFGHKIFLTSGESNMILHCDIPQGNPSDSNMFIPTLKALNESYNLVPRKLSADGGFASISNVSEAKRLGAKDVCFPKKCNMKITEMVKSSYVYKNLLNWRAGIEAVISFLKRSFGLNKATWSGLEGYKRCVRSGVASYNLLVLARHEIVAEE